MTDEEPTKTKTGVMVATPMRYFGGFNPIHEQFLKDLAALSADPECPYEFFASVVEGGRTWGRCRLVTNFRKMRAQYPNLKWLYHHDDDLDQTAAGLLRLLSHKRPIVSAMYTTKPIRTNMDATLHWACNFMHEVELQANGLLQVYEAPVGALLTHYQLFDLIEASHKEIQYTDRETGERHQGFFQEVVIEGVPYSEDFLFSWLVRHTFQQRPNEEKAGTEDTFIGIGIFIDTQIKLHHCGPDGEWYPKNDEWPPIPIDIP